MNIRKVTSLTAALTFIFLVLTGAILYIEPHGRIAYWADWHLWGLSKSQWDSIHINIGVLFLLAISFHIPYNWNIMVSYLRDKAKHVKIFTGNFNISLLITAVFILGTYGEVPPFRWVLDINESIKNSGARKYGEPPYGHAELSTLKTFTSRMDLDLAQSINLLRHAGIMFESDKQTIQEIAGLNNMTPQQVYLAIALGEKITQTMPEIPQPGIGKRSLADICQQYKLNLPIVLHGLSAIDIEAEPEMLIKEIADKNKMHSIDIYESIKSIVNEQMGK
ncbi:DUF4405 domain-containing protein [Thermodesulfobacteriota bacterium]